MTRVEILFVVPNFDVLYLCLEKSFSRLELWGVERVDHKFIFKNSEGDWKRKVKRREGKKEE
jgi:hypothetical protein